MKPFLQRIAQAFYKEYGADVVERTFVFPNRRAGLFFQRYLSDAIDRPLFSPDVMTINECIQLAAREQPVDRLGALFRLYASYRKVSGSDEGFDNFVFWGEMLLADFDDVDKYLVDPRQLFTNVMELKEIDHRFNAFTENQIAAIREFWKNFDPVPDNSMSRNFVATWRVLLPLYEDFQQALRAEGLATEGMMYRRVAERLKAGQEVEEYAGRQFVFIGFNALTPAERCVFKELQRQERADFYWDYEAAELQDEDNPASRFWRENVKAFPSRLDIEPSGEKLRDKHFELWAVPSQAGQAKQVYALLDGIFAGNDSSDGINTAVVLPDEGMLIPLIHSLPPRVDKVNVTMGFPLKATPAAGLIELVFELQRRRRDTPHGTAFYFQTVLNLLNHQYINLVCGDYVHTLTNRIAANNWVYVDAAELGGMPLMETIFTPLADTGDFLPYLMCVLRQLQASWRHSSRTADYRTDLGILGWGLFVGADYTSVNKRFTASAGVRADGCDYSSYMARPWHQLSPRASLSYVLGGGWKVSGSAGLYYQLPPYTALGYLEAGEYVNRDLRYLRVGAVSAGVNWHLRDRLVLSLEGFYKGYDDVPLSLADGIPLSCKGNDYGVVGNEALISSAEGRAYGVEAMARWQIPGRVNVVGSVTLYRSEYRGDASSAWVASAWDNRPS